VINKSDSRCAVVRFCYHSYDNRPNWTPLSPITITKTVISGCDDPTEKLSSILDKLLQPIEQQQESYLKDTYNLVNFIETTKVPVDTTLVTVDVTSLFSNRPQRVYIHTVCRAYEIFYDNKPPIPKRLTRKSAKVNPSRKLLPVH